MQVNIIFSPYFYILVLIISICGLLLADWRYGLVFWHDKLASAKAIGFTMLLLLIFDIAGIINNIFSTNQNYVVKINIISPNLPVEEILFLFMLCYVTLISYRTLAKIEVFNNISRPAPDDKKRKND